MLRIKQLVFSEGLTLAGARRRIEESLPPPADVRDAEMAEVLDTLGADARAARSKAEPLTARGKASPAKRAVTVKRLAKRF